MLNDHHQSWGISTWPTTICTTSLRDLDSCQHTIYAWKAWIAIGTYLWLFVFQLTQPATKEHAVHRHKIKGTGVIVSGLTDKNSTYIEGSKPSFFMVLGPKGMLIFPCAWHRSRLLNANCLGPEIFFVLPIYLRALVIPWRLGRVIGWKSGDSRRTHQVTAWGMEIQGDDVAIFCFNWSLGFQIVCVCATDAFAKYKGKQHNVKTVLVAFFCFLDAFYPVSAPT